MLSLTPMPALQLLPRAPDAPRTRATIAATAAHFVRRNPDDGFPCPVRSWTVQGTSDDDSMGIELSGSDFERPVGEREKCGDGWWSWTPTLTIWMRDPVSGYPGVLAQQLVGVGGHARIAGARATSEPCERRARRSADSAAAPGPRMECRLERVTVEGSVRLRWQLPRTWDWDEPVRGEAIHRLEIERQALRSVSLTIPCALRPTAPACAEE